MCLVHMRAALAATSAVVGGAGEQYRKAMTWRGAAGLTGPSRSSTPSSYQGVRESTAVSPPRLPLGAQIPSHPARRNIAMAAGAGSHISVRRRTSQSSISERREDALATESEHALQVATRGVGIACGRRGGRGAMFAELPSRGHSGGGLARGTRRRSPSESRAAPSTRRGSSIVRARATKLSSNRASALGGAPRAGGTTSAEFCP